LSGVPLIAMQGGQGSSKTWSTMQLLFEISKKEKARRITVTSYALPHLKNGAMADFENILKGEGIRISAVKNISDSTFYIKNSIVEFIGLESNPARVTGTRRDILYVNEINNKISYDVFDAAFSRTHEATFIDWNPRNEFWFHEKIQGNFEHTLIKSNFTHNEHLPKRELDNILSKKDKAGFENWWRVYGLGELGRYEGTIFSNWEFGAFDNTLSYCHALDFGFNPDPDCLIKMAVDKSKKIIYMKELIYSNNNSTDSLIKKLKGVVSPKELIIADSAESRLIHDIKLSGLNCQKASKNQIAVDIKTIQEYKIVVTPESTNIGKELNNYVWNDKKAGIPIDAFNHSIDPMRYGFNFLQRPERGGLMI
jgi:phage terminase large subunit